MNILADEQKKIFEFGISEKEKIRREGKFYDLYYKTREKDYSSFLGRLSISTREKFHKFVWLIFIVKN